jgi:hypothetical protein
LSIRREDVYVQRQQQVCLAGQPSGDRLQRHRAFNVKPQRCFLNSSDWVRTLANLRLNSIIFVLLPVLRHRSHILFSAPFWSVLLARSALWEATLLFRIWRTVHRTRSRGLVRHPVAEKFQALLVDGKTRKYLKSIEEGRNVDAVLGSNRMHNNGGQRNPPFRC